MKAVQAVALRPKPVEASFWAAAPVLALFMLRLPSVCLGADVQAQRAAANTIVLRTVKPSGLASREEAGQPLRYGLTRADLKRIESTIANIRWVDPMREIYERAAYGARRVDVRVIGCTRAYFERNPNLWIARGRFFSQRDADDRKNVVVLGHGAAQKLFGEEDPIDKAILLGRDHYYVILGVTEPPETSGAPHQDAEEAERTDVVYIPLDTMWARMGDLIVRGRSGEQVAEVVELTQITVAVKDASQIDATADAIPRLLERSHELPDYSVTCSPIETEK